MKWPAPARAARLGAAALALLLVIVGWYWTTRAFEAVVEPVHAVFEDTTPSVIHISEALSALAEIRRDVRRIHDDPRAIEDDAERTEMRTRVAALRATIQRHFAAYRAHQPFGDEVTIQSEIERRLHELERHSERVFDERDHATRKRIIEREEGPTSEALSVLLREALHLNALEAGERARQVATSHERAERRSLVFVAALVGVGAIAAFLIDRQVTKVEAERARRMAELDAFTGRVAHDLKAPLAPMLLAVSMVRREKELTEPADRALGRIDTGVRRMTALIDGLLEFARAGAAPREDARASLDDVLASLVSTMKPQVEEARATLTLEVEPGLAVRASEGALSSIVQNLARNALQYLGESERRAIVVRARRDGSVVAIEVADTGPGIPADVLRRLFKPFERGATSVPGHGLGLATVKRLAEGHGGEVTVESTVGLGSTFRVRLPSA